MDDKEFEEYLKKKLQDDKEQIKNLPYSLAEIKEIYYNDFIQQRAISPLELKMNGQKINYEIMQQHLPKKWEIPSNGQLLYNDEEVIRVLRLIVYNIGVKKTLDTLPLELIEEYIYQHNQQLNYEKMNPINIYVKEIHEEAAKKFLKKQICRLLRRKKSIEFILEALDITTKQFEELIQGLNMEVSRNEKDNSQ